MGIADKLKQQEEQAEIAYSLITGTNYNTLKNLSWTPHSHLVGFCLAISHAT